MQPDSPKSEEFINEFKNYQCDVLLVVAYGHILTEGTGDTSIRECKYSCITFTKIQRSRAYTKAILNGDKKWTDFHEDDEGLDSGPMSKQFEIKIEKDDTTADLTSKMASLAAKEVNKFCSDWPNLIDSLEEQNETDASYCPKITRNDAVIEWSDEAKNINKTINAMYPNPIISIDVNGVGINLCKSSE